MKIAAKHRPMLIAAGALVVLPFAIRALGLSIDSASVIVILAIAATGLNLCVGYTGLISFGHSAWFGIGAYAAALLQKNVFPGEIWLPLVGAMLVVGVLSAVVGALILRRRGVYFALLTLALSALTYTVAFRWSEVTGGEDGIGGLKRGMLGPIFLDEPDMSVNAHVDERRGEGPVVRPHLGHVAHGRGTKIVRR